MTKTDYKGTYTIYPITLLNNERSLYIAEIRAKEKGCGYGSIMLEEIIEYADRYSLSVCLHANSNYFEDKGLCQEDLENWYFRRGFNLVLDLDPNNGSNFFYREP